MFFIYSFSKYLLTSDYIPVIGETAVNKNNHPCPNGVYLLGEQDNNKQFISKYVVSEITAKEKSK